MQQIRNFAGIVRNDKVARTRLRSYDVCVSLATFLFGTVIKIGAAAFLKFARARAHTPHSPPLRERSKKSAGRQ